jgi:hypothetical protein
VTPDDHWRGRLHDHDAARDTLTVPPGAPNGRLTLHRAGATLNLADQVVDRNGERAG